MSIYSLVTISGQQVDDIITCDVDKSLGENNSSSSFTIQLDNFRGYNKNNYELGNEVVVYATVGSSLPSSDAYASGNYSNLGSSLIGSQLVGSSIGTYDSSLLHYWKLNEGSSGSAVDYLGTNNGSNVGATINQTGKLGSCYLAGTTSARVVFTDSASLKPTGSYSAVFWYKGTAVNNRPFGNFKRDNSNIYFGWTPVFDGTGHLSLQHAYNGPAVNIDTTTASTDAFNNGSWHHIAVTYDGTTGKAYANGSLVSSSGLRTPWYSGTMYPALFTWAINDGGAWDTNGSNTYVDDVRFYNYALPIGSIQSIFNNGSPSEYSSGASTNYYFNDYSTTLSGTYITQNGSSIIGSRVFSGATYIQDYTNVYTGSVSLIGSYSIGSQLINGSYFENYDYLYNGSYSYVNGSVLGGKIFTGILEDVKFEGKGLKEKLVLTGRDYSARLMDRTVEPEVYTNLPAGSIVLDIINKYTTDIDNSLIGTGSGEVVDRIAFNHMPVFDAIKKLADLSTYSFYVDNDKKLHFEPASSESSGYTFDNTNVLQASFKEQRDTLFNKVWVYGDRYLDGYKETFTAGSPLNGSVFNLLYNPHNTVITVAGVTIQPGAIEGITTTPGSNVKYLVNYNDKKITFTSGTSQGNNVPASGASVVINYQRSLPVVKVGDNETSKAQYGERVKVIIDKDIKDPTTAETLMQRELEKSSEPKVEGNLKIKGVVNITPGQTCIVDMPNHNVNNETYDILECNYSFNKSNNLSEDVLKVKVNEKLPDVTDTMKDMLNALRKLQGGDISTSDLITRYQYEAGSISISPVYDRAQIKSVASNNLLLDSPAYGKLDIFTTYTLTGVSFILGNSQQGLLATIGLGLGSTFGYSDYYVNCYGNFNENFTGSSFISYLSGCSLSNGSVVF